MITLTQGSNQVEIRKFLDKKLPRVRVNAGSLEYNLSGSPVIRGGSFEPKFLWTFSAFMTRPDYGTLQILYSASEAQRRSLGNPVVFLDDLTELIYEPSRTRALATGQVEQLHPGGVAYYGRFQTFFVKPPEGSDLGDYYGVNFVLGELERIAP